MVPLFSDAITSDRNGDLLPGNHPDVRRHPIDENRGDALIFTGVGSLFTAIAAVLLEYPTFATIFAFFSAFALAVALRYAREGR